MLMPIVSMNKMAMNESVAATCCIGYVTSSAGDCCSNAFTVTQKVLHGGYIGQWMTTSIVWCAPNFHSVGGAPGFIKKFPNFDIDCADCDDDPADYEWGRTDCLTNDCAPGWAILGPAGQVVSTTACEHNTTACKYIDGLTQKLVSDQHIGSTSAHAGLGGWAKPHGIVYFNS